MMAAGRVIRWTTAGAVVGVAAVAAVASYEHAYALVRAHGEAGWTGRLVPLTVDGLIYASSMVMLDPARRKVPVPPLARWLLGLGIAATLIHVPPVLPVVQPRWVFFGSRDDGGPAAMSRKPRRQLASPRASPTCRYSGKACSNWVRAPL
jgi:hypothetical protein